MTSNASAKKPVRPGVNPEYDAFEGLAKKLVSVPKSEIDAKRAKENGSKPSTRRK